LVESKNEAALQCRLKDLTNVDFIKEQFPFIPEADIRSIIKEVESAALKESVSSPEPKTQLFEAREELDSHQNQSPALPTSSCTSKDSQEFSHRMKEVDKQIQRSSQIDR